MLIVWVTTKSLLEFVCADCVDLSSVFSWVAKVVPRRFVNTIVWKKNPADTPLVTHSIIKENTTQSMQTMCGKTIPADTPLVTHSIIEENTTQSMQTNSSRYPLVTH